MDTPFKKQYLINSSHRSRNVAVKSRKIPEAITKQTLYLPD